MEYPVSAIVIGAFLAYLAASITGNAIARAKFPIPMAENRLGCIDGLRGYLALSVLVHHFIIWMQVTRLEGSWDPPTIYFFNQLGAGGVALFFMTTGFVFYPRVLKGFKNCLWIAIYTTRIFRIMPLIIFSVAVITAVIAARTGHGLDSEFPIAAAKWITTRGEPPLLDYPDSGRLNAYVLWSLWYEWLFYVFVLPTCAFAMDIIRGRISSWMLPLALLALAVVARVLQLPFSMLRYLPLFAIGMLAYECQRHERIVSALRTPTMAFAAVTALCFGMLSTPTPYDFSAPLFGFFFICVACGNSIGGILKTKGSFVLGECSYGIYLLHGIILSIFFVDAAKLNEVFTTYQLPFILPIIIVIIILITSFTYLAVERPAIRAGSWLAKRLLSRQLRLGNPKTDIVP